LAPKEIPELDSSGLRNFPVWPWIGAGVLSGFGAIAPMSLNPVYKLWMRFGLIMNRITTPIILGLVFFVVFAPIAFVMRIAGRDRLSKKPDDDVESYRVESTVQPNHKMEKPY